MPIFVFDFWSMSSTMAPGVSLVGQVVLPPREDGDTELDEPNLEAAQEERWTRNRAAMQAVDGHIAKQVLPLPEVSVEARAATRIQALYRGHRGRQLYLNKLREQFEKEEAALIEKTMLQVAEGELLVQNHKLEVDYADSQTTRRNKARQYTTHVITIQRAWRRYQERKHEVPAPCNIQCPPVRTQVMSQPTGNSAEAPHDENIATIKNVYIEPDPNSCISDCSEMADPIKQHLADVEIVQQEAANGVDNQSKDTIIVQQKIQREDNETEEEFQKRLKKINFLSLAQEFAELKKVDSAALPFDLHKSSSGGAGVNMELSSPLSDSAGSVDSALATPGSSDEKEDLVFGRAGHDDDEEEEDISTVPPPARPNSIHRPTVSSDSSSGGSGGAAVGNNSIRALKVDEAGAGGGAGGDFDVYNIETTLPQMDWALLEQQLKRAAEEEEKQKQARVTDREEIRRRLAAAGAEEEYYGGERTYRKPGLGTRLQGAMNLQICFMNDPDAAVSGADQSCVDSAALQDTSTEASKVVPPSQQAKILPKQDDKQVSGAEQQEDFFQRQQRLQEEATMALAQVRPMAHMQLEIEKQNRKKSPIAEIIQVGIPGFCDGKKKKLDNMMLGDMNVAQLQVVVNDLHSQIESLNEELVRILVERDDLHMQQDSMLVNSEDLLARAQEYSMKVQSPRKGEKTQTKDRKR